MSLTRKNNKSDPNMPMTISQGVVWRPNLSTTVTTSSGPNVYPSSPPRIHRPMLRPMLFDPASSPAIAGATAWKATELAPPIRSSSANAA